MSEKIKKISEKISTADARISAALRIEDVHSLRFRIAAFIAHSGDSWIWCGVLFVLWLFASGERERTLAWCGGTIAVTAVIVFILKRIIARTRPEGEWGGIYRRTDPYSFPSGHSVRAGLIVTLAFSAFGPGWITALFCLWAVLMILSRVATGVHYFFDIIAGFLLGLLIGRGWMALRPWFYETFAVLFDKSSWFN